MNPVDQRLEAPSAEADRPEGKGSEAGYPRKRARTRRRLLTAGMEVLAKRGPDGATIGEIARTAKVASGTFYNHFLSLADLVDAVTDELTRGVRIGRETLEAIEHDPALRVLLGTRQLLQLAQVDPTAAAAFVSLLADVPSFRTRVRSIVGGAVSDGIESDRFVDRELEAVSDALLGAVVQWMRSILAGGASNDLEERLAIALAIVGVDPTEVPTLVAAASVAD